MLAARPEGHERQTEEGLWKKLGMLIAHAVEPGHSTASVLWPHVRISAPVIASSNLGCYKQQMGLPTHSCPSQDFGLGLGHKLLAVRSCARRNALIRSHAPLYTNNVGPSKDHQDNLSVSDSAEAIANLLSDDAELLAQRTLARKLNRRNLISPPHMSQFGRHDLAADPDYIERALVVSAPQANCNGAL